MNAKKFRSCFVTDVQVMQGKAVLADSAGRQYVVSLEDESLKAQFASWFKAVFCKGVAQTLTIFSYETADISECETELHITKFMNVAQQLLEK